MIKLIDYVFSSFPPLKILILLSQLDIGFPAFRIIFFIYQPEAKNNFKSQLGWFKQDWSVNPGCGVIPPKVCFLPNDDRKVILIVDGKIS
jgi:hypothetical protein